MAQATEQRQPTAPARSPTAQPVAVVPTQMPVPVPTENDLVQQAIREAESELAAAEAASSAELKYRSQPAEKAAWDKDSALAEREIRAKQDLAGARLAFSEAQSLNNVPKLRASREASRRIRQEFDAIQRSLAVGRDALAAQQEKAKSVRGTTHAGPLQKEISDRVKSARQILADASRAQQLSAAAAAAATRLQRLIQEFARNDTALPVEQLEFNNRLKAAVLEFTTALKQPSPQPRPTVPPWLFDAGLAYFAGDYAKAIQLLAKAPDSVDQHATAEARLLSSAARYAMYLMGGEKDKELKDAAIADATACHRLDAQVPRNQRVFSPRFIEFYMAANSAKMAREAQ